MILVFGGFNYGEGESYIEVLVGVGDGRFFYEIFIYSYRVWNFLFLYIELYKIICNDNMIFIVFIL